MAGNCFLGDKLCDAPSVWPAVGHCEPICCLTSILALMSLVWEEADVTHRITIPRRGQPNVRVRQDSNSALRV